MQPAPQRASRARRESRLFIKCPHCDAPATGRTSTSITPLHRDIYYQCTNLHCGCAFVATLEIRRMVTASQTPRRGVSLPMLERGSHRPVFPANDEAPDKINTG